MRFLLAGLILLLSLLGCSSPKEQAAADERHKQLTEAVNRPLEQAKDVEKQVFDSAEQQKKQADEL